MSREPARLRLVLPDEPSDSRVLNWLRAAGAILVRLRTGVAILVGFVVGAIILAAVTLMFGGLK
jgi:hypothetical protein